MTFIVPFEEEFAGGIHTVYYVNEDNHKTSNSSVTSSQVCPHCNERHIFKVFELKRERVIEGWVIEIYDGKCPACRKKFDIEIEFEIE